jgi:hypothetical protein
VTEFVRDSFASIHATVFDRLVGVPGTMVVLTTICVYGDKGEMGGNIQTFMMHYAIQLGVRTYHKYMSMACATSCTVLIYYSVPWYSRHRDHVRVHT